MLALFLAFAVCKETCVEADTCTGENYYWEGVAADGYTLKLVPNSTGGVPSVQSVLMIIQMQGGMIDNNNTQNYGSNNNSANGYTEVGGAGLYEFAVVVSVAQNTGTCEVKLDRSLTNTYDNLRNNRFQAIGFSFCSSVVVNNPQVPDWNGYTGGVFVMLAEVINLGKVNMVGKGFRGGPGFGTKYFTFFDDPGNYRDDSATTFGNDQRFNGPKGEGFIGYPNYPTIPNGRGNTTYPEGFDSGKGAPGNAGGGGSWTDSGGGGGGNAGRGGDGNKNTIHALAFYAEQPGFGGAPVPLTATSRLFLGKVIHSKDVVLT